MVTETRHLSNSSVSWTQPFRCFLDHRFVAIARRGKAGAENDAALARIQSPLKAVDLIQAEVAGYEATQS